MTDQIRERVQRAHDLFERIREIMLIHELSRDDEMKVYHGAIDGSSILECVLEDLDAGDDDDASSADELRHDLDKEIRGES